MKLTLRFLIVTMLATAMSGCPNNKCFKGQEIVIPSSDTTVPSVLLEIHLPNGQIKQVYNVPGLPPGSVPLSVTMPVSGGGQVTVVANAKGSLGIQDVQIWAAPSNAGKPGAPTTSNKDNGKAGETGCTERLTSTNLTVRKSPTVVSYEVRAVGINFGGVSASPPLVILEAR